MPGPDAGRFEPAKASVRSKSATRNSTTGEEVITYPEAFRTYIRFVSSAGREGTTNHQVISASQVKIRIRRNSQSLTIKPYWQILHEGFT